MEIMMLQNIEDVPNNVKTQEILKSGPYRRCLMQRRSKIY